MNLRINNFKSILFLSVFSIFINFYSGSLGVLPIDTFAFFDTGYRILSGDIPFNDYWTISGPFIDFLQAFYFLIFGITWKSYLLNGAIINLLLTLISFFFFKKIGLKNYHSLFYSMCVAILGNPSMGTPFPDHYSAFFSLFALLSLFSAVNTNKNIYWFLIPILLFIAFFCKQTPATYVLLLIVVNIIFFLISKKSFSFLTPIILGSMVSILFFIFTVWLLKISYTNIFNQYFLFPRTIGLSRALDWSFTFNKGVANFKHIYIIAFPLILIFLRNFLIIKKFHQTKEFIIDFNIIIFTFLLIFHQFLTLNFIFIFFIIPYLCSRLQINLKNNNSIKLYSSLILIFCLFITLKFHFRFNEERKMLGLENINLNSFYEGKKISSKLSGLKWVTKEFVIDDKKEISKLKVIKQTLQEEKRKTMLLSNYNFFSIILEKQLNSPNRWYGGKVAHPSKENRYYENYLNFNYQIITKKNIEVIYVDMDIINYQKELLNDILNFLPSNCAKIYNIKDIILAYDISNCYR